MRQEVLDGAVFGNQLDRGLLADSGHARNIVGRVAPEGHNVDDLFCPFNAPALLNLRQSQHFHCVSHPRWLVKERVRRHQLPEILVWRDHIALKSFLFRAPHQRADDVVRFIAIAGEPRDAKRVEHPSHMRERVAQFLRHLVHRSVGKRDACVFRLESVDQMAEDPAAAPGAEAVVALLAEATATAGGDARDQYPIALGQRRDRRAGFDDGADCLVPEDRSRLHLGNVSLEDV